MNLIQLLWFMSIAYAHYIVRLKFFWIHFYFGISVISVASVCKTFNVLGKFRLTVFELASSNHFGILLLCFYFFILARRIPLLYWRQWHTFFAFMHLFRFFYFFIHCDFYFSIFSCPIFWFISFRPYVILCLMTEAFIYTREPCRLVASRPAVKPLLRYWNFWYCFCCLSVVNLLIFFRLFICQMLQFENWVTTICVFVAAGQ